MKLIKSLLFFILVPGMVVGAIPVFLLMQGPYLNLWILSYFAMPLWVIGGVGLIWCFADFLLRGHGTPAPFDPPTELVVGGLYRFTRNPMYLSVLLMVLAEFLWFGHLLVLLYAGILFLAFNTFVRVYEEPTLKRKFGRSYENYTKSVPRWWGKTKMEGGRMRHQRGGKA